MPLQQPLFNVQYYCSNSLTPYGKIEEKNNFFMLNSGEQSVLSETSAEELSFE